MQVQLAQLGEQQGAGAGVASGEAGHAARCGRREGDVANPIVGRPRRCPGHQRDPQAGADHSRQRLKSRRAYILLLVRVGESADLKCLAPEAMAQIMGASTDSGSRSCCFGDLGLSHRQLLHWRRLGGPRVCPRIGDVLFYSKANRVEQFTRPAIAYLGHKRWRTRLRA